MTQGDNFKVVENVKIEGSGKVIIQAFSGSGLVASLVSHHLIEKWKLTEVGYISSKYIPTVGIVRDGIIERPVRIYMNHSFILVLTEIGINQDDLVPFIENLYDWYVSLDPASIIIVGALPTGRPANAEDLRYSVVASDEMTRDYLNDKGIWTMPQGAVYGSVALSLMEAKNADISCFAILSHCIATIPDYLAAKKVVELLSIVLDTEIPVTPLDVNALELKEHLIQKELEKGADEDYEVENFELYDDFDFDDDDDDLSSFI